MSLPSLSGMTHAPLFKAAMETACMLQKPTDLPTNNQAKAQSSRQPQQIGNLTSAWRLHGGALISSVPATLTLSRRLGVSYRVSIIQ
jgi:hypothetical protein